jgi:sec-independent protein translocase protein TatB
MREFKKATSELKETLQVDGELSEVKKAFNDFQSDVNASVQPAAQAEEPAGPPAVPAPAEPAGAAPGAAPEAGDPSAAEKVKALDRAFEAWQAEKDREEAAAGQNPAPASGTAPAGENPKSH